MKTARKSWRSLPLWSVLLCLLALVDLAPEVHAQEAHAPVTLDRARLEVFLDGLAQGQMQTLGIPGLAISVVTRDGTSVVKTYGTGFNGGPVAIDPATTLLPIASISKAVLGVALMRAMEKGLIHLDDPVSKHLPFTLDAYPGARPVTVHDLVRHEAGFEERWLATGTGFEPDSRSWEQILSQTAPRMIAVPGDYPSYSNYGSTLPAFMIERTSGKPYWEFLRDEVFRPLGMARSTVQHPMPPEVEASFAEGWTVSNGVTRPPKKTFNVRSHPAGRVAMTMNETRNLMLMLLNDGLDAGGNPFLAKASVDAMLDGSNRQHDRLPGVGVYFAEKDIEGIRFTGHGGDGGTHHTDMILNRDLGLGIFVIVLSNPGPHTRDHLTRAIVREVVASAGVPPAQPIAADKNADLERFAGQYRHYRWAFTSVEKVLQLISEFTVSATPRGSLIVTGRLGPGEYVRIAEEPLFQHVRTGELLYFWTSSQGATNLVMGSFPFVTAFKLDTLDTQSFNQSAFWTFVVGLTLLGTLSLAFGGASMIRSKPIAGIATGMFGLALTVCGSGLLYYFMQAAAIPEPVLTQRLPDFTMTSLAIPVVASGIVALYALGLAQGRFRPAHRIAWIAIAPGLLLFGLFVLYLVHWNAFGWNLP